MMTSHRVAWTWLHLPHLIYDIIDDVMLLCRCSPAPAHSCQHSECSNADAALHARFTTWDSRHHHLSAHGSVGQHTDQLDSKEKKEGGGLASAFPVWDLSVTTAVTLLLR